VKLGGVAKKDLRFTYPDGRGMCTTTRWSTGSARWPRARAFIRSRYMCVLCVCVSSIYIHSLIHSYIHTHILTHCLILAHGCEGMGAAGPPQRPHRCDRARTEPSEYPVRRLAQAKAPCLRLLPPRIRPAGPVFIFCLATELL
jgi:hypothetical protein